MEKRIKPVYPNSQFKTFCYIKSVITRPNIIAGDYSYYDKPCSVCKCWCGGSAMKSNFIRFISFSLSS